MFEKERQAVEKKIQGHLKAQGLSMPGNIPWARIPFSGEWGIATSFFQAAAKESHSGVKGNVPQRAQEIAESVAQELGTPAGFSRVAAIKGYLNLYFSTPEYSRQVIDGVLKEKDDYGKGADKGELVMVEFSQPNTHKAMHVGHLRSMILGTTIANIIEYSGYQVIRANYIGDYGRDVIKWLWNYRKNHAGEKPGEDATRWMGDIYAEATKEIEAHPEFEPEIQALFDRWEHDDPDVVGLWKETRQWSLDGFNAIYDTLGIHFDHIYYESDVEKSGKKVVAELIEKGIAVDERDQDGAVIVPIDKLLKLEKETYRVMVVLRSDGTSLYSAWDLSLAQKKFEDYDLAKSIYVVDVRQSLHFQQVFKTLELAGFEKIKNAYHLPYEIVTLPGNVTMKSREGTVVLLEDLIREAVQRAYDVGKERNPELDEKSRESVANAVAIGAIKFPMLARDNTKVVTFDWDSALDFYGHSAPYIQYAHVRANSLLARMESALPKSQLPAEELTPEEVRLIELISRVPEEVQRAAKEYKTLHITNLAYDIAKSFNDFYNNCPVLQAEPKVRDPRLRLVAASQQAIANLLGILGIQAPDVM